jgi:glycosyltransferase involved in cell wall biosynthesis
MAEAPEISVLMPTCCRSGFWVQAVQSLLKQRFTRWELIVVEDGGSEESVGRGEVERLVAGFSDARIRYHRIEALGRPGAVRNVALSMAQGAYVFPLDDDDELEPACLETLWRYLEEAPQLEAVITASVLIDAESRFLAYPTNLGQTPEGAFYLKALPEGREITWQDVYEKISASVLPRPSMLVRREALVAVGGYDPDLTYWEDAKLVVNLLLRGLERVRFLPLPLYRYRLHGQNLTRTDAQTTRRWIEDKWAFFDWLYALPVVPPGMESRRQWEVEKIYRDHLPPLMAQGQVALVRELLQEAWERPGVDRTQLQKALGPAFAECFPSAGR